MKARGKTKTKGKIICLILVLTMCLCTMPMTAFAKSTSKAAGDKLIQSITYSGFEMVIEGKQPNNGTVLVSMHSTSEDNQDYNSEIMTLTIAKGTNFYEYFSDPNRKRI